MTSRSDAGSSEREAERLAVSEICRRVEAATVGFAWSEIGTALLTMLADRACRESNGDPVQARTTGRRLAKALRDQVDVGMARRR